MCTAGQRVSLTITGPGPSFFSSFLSRLSFLSFIFFIPFGSHLLSCFRIFCIFPPLSFPSYFVLQSVLLTFLSFFFFGARSQRTVYPPFPRWFRKGFEYFKGNNPYRERLKKDIKWSWFFSKIFVVLPHLTPLGFLFFPSFFLVLLSAVTVYRSPYLSRNYN